MKKLILILFAASIAAYAQFPLISTISPASGGFGSFGTFSATGTFSTPQNVLYIWLRIGDTNHGCNALVQMQYGAISYLLNDAGTSWGSSAANGSGATLQNSQCILQLSGTSGSTSGNTGAASALLSFKSSFAGVRAFSAQAISYDATTSPWFNAGAWAVPGTSCAPGVTNVSPFSGTGSSQTFNVFASDPCAGSQNIQYLWLRIGEQANGCNALWMFQDNTIHLLSDDGTNWNIGGTMGGSGTISNGQCSVPLSSAGKNTGVGWATMNFLSSFVGTRPIYATVEGYNGLGWNWFTAGNFTIPTMPTGTPDATMTWGVSPNTDTGYDPYTGTTMSMPSSINPGGEVNLSSPDGNPSALAYGTPIAISVRNSKPNSPVAIVGTWIDDPALTVDLTLTPDQVQNCLSPTNNFSWNGQVAGYTDSSGYFLYQGAVQSLPGGQSYGVFVGGTDGKPTCDALEGTVDFFAYNGATGLPAPPTYYSVRRRTDGSEMRGARADMFTVKHPLSTYRQVGARWRYDFEIDTTKADIVRIGDDIGYLGDRDAANPNRKSHPNGWNRAGWFSMGGTPEEHSKISFTTDWMPGPISVLFSATPSGIDLQDNRVDTGVLYDRESIFKNSVRKHVIGPAIKPRLSEDEFRMLIREWVDQGNLFLAPLTPAGVNLREALGKLSPSEGYEQNVVNCIAEALAIEK